MVQFQTGKRLFVIQNGNMNRAITTPNSACAAAPIYQTQTSTKTLAVGMGCATLTQTRPFGALLVLIPLGRAMLASTCVLMDQVCMMFFMLDTHFV